MEVDELKDRDQLEDRLYGPNSIEFPTDVCIMLVDWTSNRSSFGESLRTKWALLGDWKQGCGERSLDGRVCGF